MRPTPGSKYKAWVSHVSPYGRSNLPGGYRSIQPQAIGQVKETVAGGFGSHHQGTGKGEGIAVREKKPEPAQAARQLAHELVVGIAEGAVNVEAQGADAVNPVA